MANAPWARTDVGRATRKHGEETKARILAEALPLFAEHGFSGTSTRMIAAAAEVNVATLAYYYGDKQGLYVAAMDRMYEDLSAAADGALTLKASAGETIDGVVDVAWAFVKSHETHIRLLMRHVLDAGRWEDASVERWNEPLMKQAAAVVGLFRPDWPEAHRRMLVLTTMHSIVRLTLEDEEQLQRMLGGVDRDEAVPGWFKAFLRRELGIG